MENKKEFLKDLYDKYVLFHRKRYYENEYDLNLEKYLIKNLPKIPIELSIICFCFDQHLWEKKFKNFAKINDLEFTSYNGH